MIRALGITGPDDGPSAASSQRRNQARRRGRRAIRMPRITTAIAMTANGHSGWCPLI
ncbi:MAG: hypothetical protein H0X39_17145 [Actinobacteria bacterium]|nr:hypothetical protein [Actinomycetota bacterium]